MQLNNSLAQSTLLEAHLSAEIGQVSVQSVARLQARLAIAHARS